MSKVYTTTENINTETIDFGSPKRGKDNRLFVSIGIRESEDDPVSNFLYQFTKNRVSEINGNVIEVGIPTSIHDYIIDLEEGILGKIKQNKDVWFPDKNIEDSFLDTSFMSVLRKSKRQSFLKVRINDDCQYFDVNKEEIDHDSILKDSLISLIVNISGIWFTKTRCGITMKVCQVKVHTLPKPLKGMNLFTDDDDDQIDPMDFPDHVE
jgi:hypothetical protein